ncbi:fumarylacetoacetate hydrolase family protein ASCRUDRAFT_68414 [Ascoidea rubescens DSM 1968]|uniref:Fumarylacetoacetase-like C-terminal domain-containing protein n=1 Tax=Ascoidea rubescens DSM 1968 TaxID=1344418 RepID=A0A1D2VS64_9ASCO|nr:hypothetical protein ASCRUDRAFT_68414 [Ascoidea rubescens DSM 1968]ODV64439.1 hypothetical protein ASCRUDRAFT_68414 [Ascoidea rubescens DSM 1968]
MSFSRLVRFLAEDGKIYYGDGILPKHISDSSLVKEAKVILGNILSNNYSITDKVLKISKLLSPLDPFRDISTVRFLGMNYRKHAIEINAPIPKYPVLFYKPITAINNPFDDIIVPKVAQVYPSKVDYEVELVIVIGKTGKNILLKNADDHILGYTVGNDVSQRTWQIERGGSQFSTGKMFDSWAPIGPAIVSKSLIQNPNNLGIKSEINGELRQNSNTKDLIFNVQQLVSFLSQGTTLNAGDLIFTGTPEGVGMGFNPPKWLKHNDVSTFNIENIGTIQNRFIFEDYSEEEKGYDYKFEDGELESVPVPEFESESDKAKL